MDENSSSMDRTSHRRSLMGPLILITLGIIFLLSNLGIIEGDIWGLIVSFWPVILIAIGVDSILNREGLVGPTVMIGLGIVFLLSNFGFLAISVWTLVQHLWPVVLVAIGFDIIFGRRSLIGSLIGLLVVLALLVGAVAWFGLDFSRGQALQGEEIRQELQTTSDRAHIVLSPGVGSLVVEPLEETGVLVAGRASTGRGMSLTQDYALEGGEAEYELKSTGAAIFFPIGGSGLNWDLGLSPEVPLELTADMGAGEIDLDLTGLEVETLDVNQGVGQVEVTFPAEGQIRAEVNSAIGQTVLIIPEGMEVRINASTGIGNLDLPSGFEEVGGAYETGGYDEADNRLDLEASQAIGQIVVRRR